MKILFLLVMVAAPSMPAQAQSARTYVSGTGSDSNPCTVSSPCKTLQVALSKTLPGGEIDAVNSANYGYVTINQAVTIIGAHGTTGVLATSTVTGVTITAGANDIIMLQGLEIDGAGSGANGIQFNSGAALNVQNTVIRGFTTGINFQPSASSALSVGGTLISNNSTGISFQNAAASTAVLNDVQVVNNGTGIVAFSTNSTNLAILTVQSGVISNNSTVGILSNGLSNIAVSNSMIVNNGVGVEAQNTGALLLVSASTVSGNGTGWMANNSGQVISSASNSIGANTTGNTAPPTSVASSTPTTPPTTSFIAKNIVTDFGAKCNGVADDSPAFGAFNTWAVANQGSSQVQLTIPSGGVCQLMSEAGIWWAKGIKSLLVLGYGATISDGGGGAGFTLGGVGVYHDNRHNARVATVNAGTATVTLLTPSQRSLFTVGSWALITGYDLQGYGYPNNAHFFEYVQISAINAATGQITFAAPLKNSYKSTWPLYWSGDALEVDQGGPATLYALDPSWDTEVEYRGLTITRPNVQMFANGRSVTFRDVSLANDVYCIVPTQNLVWRAINSTMRNCSLEVDKLVTTIEIVGGIVGTINFQSSSIDSLNVTDATVSGSVNGTPKKFVGLNSKIGTLAVGAYAYGRTDEVACTNCVISNFLAQGVVDKGGLQDVGVNNLYTMSDGVIIVPVGNPVPWAVPGTNLIWSGAYDTQRAFRVIDVVRDASNTYVKTTLTGGFPAMPTNNGKLTIKVHPAPKFTCTNCTDGRGNSIFVGHPSGAPLFSYWKATLAGNALGTQGAPSYTAPIWGSLTDFRVDVTSPYRGSLSSLNFHAMSAFDNYPTIKTDGSIFTYAPIINLKAAGQRSITVSSVTGSQNGDSGLPVPEAVWFTAGSGMGADADITGESPSVWPTLTIEIRTDQGVVNP